MGAQTEDRQYRKGVVIGLTMAEIMLLLLFLLLMILGYKLQESDQEIQTLSQQNQEYKSIYAENIDIFEEYTLLKKQVNDQQVILDNIEDHSELIKAIQDISPSASSDELADLIKEKKDVFKIALQDEEKLSDMHDPEVVKINLDICMKQNEHYQKEFAKSNGLDHPPCLPGRNNIFDAVLTDNGIVLRNLKLSQKDIDAQKIPVSNLIYDKALSNNNFNSATASIYDWSVNNHCRFRVSVYDQTNPCSKRLFQKLDQTVQGHFYIYEASRENRECTLENISPAEDGDDQNKHEVKKIFNFNR